MSFSGYWLGPYVFDPRVIMTGTPYVVKYASTCRSPPALDAEYGLEGLMVSLSVKEPESIDPYPSSVETCTMREMPCARTTSSSVCVPRMSVWRNASGSAMERSTWVSAAKLTMASTPAAADSTASRSQMSPRTKLERGSAATFSRLSRFPAYVSVSKQTISQS